MSSKADADMVLQLPAKREGLGYQIDPTARIYPTARIVNNDSLIMEKNTMIGDFVFVSVPDLYMAEGSQINGGTRVVGKKFVGIGMNCVVSYGCTLITSSDSSRGVHMNDASPLETRVLREGTIDIGPDVFIGAHSIIMPGITIFPRVIVRAFSYVNKTLDMAGGIYGGQPARLLRHRPIGRQCSNRD